MKKLLQRVFGVTASAVLLLTSALPSAFADGHQHHGGDKVITKSDDGLGEVDRYKITLTDIENYGEDKVEFGAYQIFTGTVKNGGTLYTDPGNYVGDEDNTDKSMIPLTDIKWGSAFGKIDNDDWKNEIVEFVYTLATTPTVDTEHSATFGTFHGFDGDATDNSVTGLNYATFAGSDENTLADRFYTDTENKTIANVKFDKLATEVADVINKHNDRAWLQAFTDILGGYAQGTEGYAKGNFVHQYYGGEKSDDTYVIKDVPEGYYMILDRSGIDKDGSTPDESYSARMLFVANNITQQIKQDVPSLEKEIMRTGDTDDGHKTEAAGVGDEVNFRLTGQLPSNYDQYTLGYQFTFTDELSKGLTLQGTDDVYVTVTAKNVYINGELEEGPVTIEKVRRKPAPPEKDEGGEEYEIISLTGSSEGSSHITGTNGNYKEEYNPETNVLTVTFPCLKEITGDNAVPIIFCADSEIYIDYTAVVNENAIVSPTDGNKNTAKLTYSDNPQSYGDTDNTTEEHATVYTFGLDITKVDAADFLKDSAKAGLSGAKFAVARPVKAGENITGWEIAKFTKIDETAYGTMNPKPAVKSFEKGYYSIVSWEKLALTDVDDMSKFDVKWLDIDANSAYKADDYNIATLEGGFLNISGLDSGVTYTIAETKTPEGEDYAKIEPFVIRLEAAKDADEKEYTGSLKNATSDEDTDASFSFDKPVDITDKFLDGDNPDGSAEMIVANFKYVDLPSTGGVGTYWFYILGAGGLAISFVLFRLSRKKIVQ